MCRSALCSPLLSPFGLESVTVFDHAPLCASPSQKPACGLPARFGGRGGREPFPTPMQPPTDVTHPNAGLST